MGKRTAAMSAAHDFSDAQKAEFREAFRLFDKDGDQMITEEELKTAMMELGENPTQAQLQNMIKEVDGDGSGTINFDEFLNLLSRKMNESRQSGKEENGSITPAELKQVMFNLGEELSDEDLAEMISEVDLDKDGEINFEEFLKCMEI